MVDIQEGRIEISPKTTLERLRPPLTGSIENGGTLNGRAHYRMEIGNANRMGDLQQELTLAQERQVNQCLIRRRKRPFHAERVL